MSGDAVVAHVSEWVWLLPTFVVTWGVKFLRDLAHSVNDLNKNISLIVQRVDGHEKSIKDHELRLRAAKI